MLLINMTNWSKVERAEKLAISIAKNALDKNKITWDDSQANNYACTQVVAFFRPEGESYLAEGGESWWCNVDGEFTPSTSKKLNHLLGLIAREVGKEYPNLVFSRTHFSVLIWEL